MSCPGVSVIIPTRNNGPELERAIHSILAQDALTRGKCSVEIIIVNDASEAQYLPFLQQLPAGYPQCRLLHLDKPSGPSAARNTGIREAHEDFISFLDADDEWPHDKLTLLLPFFADPSVEVAGGKVKYIFKEGVTPSNMVYEDDQNRLTHVHLGALLLRESLFGRGLFFDESLRFSEDVDWWLRLRENNTGIVISEATTLLYHVHGNNMSFEKKIDDLQLLRVLHKSVSRRKNMDLNQNIPQLKDFRVQQEDPLISIVIPLYNGKNLIGNTIESVLAQTYKNWELIVVDDGSADAGGDYVRKHYPVVKVIRQENAGVAAARNKGIGEAKGEIIALLDQDDIWLPDKLREQWDLLKTDPYCAFVTCNNIFRCREGVILPANFSDELFKERRSLFPSALLIRRHALRTVNGFEESMTTSSDVDLIRKLRNAGFKENNVNRLLLEKWYHGANAGLNKETMRREFLAVLYKQTKGK